MQLLWQHSDRKPQTKLNKLIIFVCEIAHFAARCLAASGFTQTEVHKREEKIKLTRTNDNTKIKLCVEKFSLALHYPPRVEDQPCLLLFRDEKKEKESRSPLTEKAFRWCYNKPFSLGFIDQSLWANVIILINRGTAGRIIMRLTLINDQPNAALFSQGPPPLTRSHGPAACTT